MDLAGIRTDYRLATLDEAVAGNNPLSFFEKWLAEATAAHIDEVNAMTLATAGSDGRPHARIVLLKGLHAEGFCFYTNYESNKGVQLAENSHAALVFFWKELERQVRVEGRVAMLEPRLSDAYFASRPLGSRIGAWASPQSQVIASRAVLEEADAAYEKQFGGDVPRPSFWGGYRVVPEKIEFWQGRSSRLHDRIVFERESGEAWRRYRIAP